MNLNDIKPRPFPEGIIRVASTTDALTDKTAFDGRMEILARHHASTEGASHPSLAPHATAQQQAMQHPTNKAAQKLVEIPVRMFFNKASNALHAVYQAYDANGRPVCRGDGQTARRRLVEEGVETIAQSHCSGSEQCEFANSGQATCRRQVSMTVQIKDQENPLSVFEVRTSSYNSYKALQGQLALIENRFGGLRHVPLKLQLWQASNQASDFEAFDVFKLALDAANEIEAMRQTRTSRQEEAEVGLSCDTDSAFDSTCAMDLEAGPDDFVVVEDFYRPITPHTSGRRQGSKSVASALKATDRGTIGNLAGELIAQAMAAAGSHKTAPTDVPF